jgi:hypothetical protein
MNVVISVQLASRINLNQIEPLFMYSKLLKDTFLEMKYAKNSLKKRMSFCRSELHEQFNELAFFNECATTYHPSKAS